MINEESCFYLQIKQKKKRGNRIQNKSLGLHNVGALCIIITVTLYNKVR